MSQEDIARLVDNALAKYKRVARPTLVQLVAQFMPGISPANWQDTCNTITEYLNDEVRAGRLVLTRGMKGGISKPDLNDQWQSYAAVMQAKDVGINPVVSVAVNDHVCPCCKNDKVSKAERTCWKCGGNLH